MLYLGLLGNKEVALRFKYDPKNICHYETKIMVRGSIFALTGRKPSKTGFPIEYSGYYEIEFDRLKNYQDGKF